MHPGFFIFAVCERWQPPGSYFDFFHTSGRLVGPPVGIVQRIQGERIS